MSAEKEKKNALAQKLLEEIREMKDLAVIDHMREFIKVNSESYLSCVSRDLVKFDNGSVAKAIVSLARSFSKDPVGVYRLMEMQYVVKLIRFMRDSANANAIEELFAATLSDKFKYMPEGVTCIVMETLVDVVLNEDINPHSPMRRWEMWAGVVSSDPRTIGWVLAAVVAIDPMSLPRIVPYLPNDKSVAYIVAREYYIALRKVSPEQRHVLMGDMEKTIESLQTPNNGRSLQLLYNGFKELSLFPNHGVEVENDPVVELSDTERRISSIVTKMVNGWDAELMILSIVSKQEKEKINEEGRKAMEDTINMLSQAHEAGRYWVNKKKPGLKG